PMIVCPSVLRPPPRPTLFPYTTLFRSSNASRAALTARSASGIPASATWPTTSSGELGLIEAIVLSVQTFSPLITSGYFWPSCVRSEEHTSELQSRGHLVCRLLLEKKKN